MAKLSPLKPREVISKLKKLRFVVDHVSGSHYIMFNARTKTRIPIPYHAKDLKSENITKEAGFHKRQGPFFLPRKANWGIKNNQIGQSLKMKSEKSV